MIEETEGAIVPTAGAAGIPVNAFATARAYAADWRHFCGWCAEVGCAPLPAPPAAVAAYLASLAELDNRAALDRSLAAIGQ